MTDRTNPTREERLAAKLRENLKRRKQQARARAAPIPPAEPRSSQSPAADQAALKPGDDSDS